jgi:hypothetical protein
MRIQITRVLLGTAFASLAVFAGPASPDLGQGWTDQQRDFYWYANQGSRLIPRDWLLALEREDSQDLFLADSLARFGYLAPNAPSPRNPDKLPIGFAVDPATARHKAWIGMTCAAATSASSPAPASRCASMAPRATPTCTRSWRHSTRR